MPATTEELMTVSDLESKLKLSSDQIYQLVNQEKIPHHYVGVQIRFYPSEIDEWVRSGAAAKARNRPVAASKRAGARR